MKSFFTKKIKNIVCLVCLILLGIFILKHFNLIEGVDDTTTAETPEQVQERKFLELATKVGKAAGDGVAESNWGKNLDTIELNINSGKPQNSDIQAPAEGFNSSKLTRYPPSLI